MTDRCIICDWPIEPNHCEKPSHCCFIIERGPERDKVDRRRRQLKAVEKIEPDPYRAAAILRAVLDTQ